MLSNDTPIPKSNLLHQNNRVLPPPHSSPRELSCSQQPGRCVVCLSTDTHLCLDFLLHHHPHGSYHGEHGVFQPHIKASSSEESFPPSTASLPRVLHVPAWPRGCCRAHHGQFAVPSLVVQHSPAPRAAQGEHGAAASAVQEGGWMPAQQHRSFRWSLSRTETAQPAP